MSFITAIFSISMSILLMNNIIKEETRNKFLSLTVATLIIINPFSIELFLFIEKGIMNLSILFTVIATKNFIEYMKNNKKKSILKSLIFMTLAISCYQSTASLFIIISAIFIIKYSEKIKKFILNTAICSMIYGISGIINFGIVKYLYKSDRIGKLTIILSLKRILKQSIYIITTTYKIIPNNLFAIFLIIITTIIILTIIIKSKSKKTIILNTFLIFACMIITYISAMIPHLLRDYRISQLAPRTTYAVTSLIGIIELLYLTMHKEENVDKKLKINYYYEKFWKNSFIIINIIFLLIQFKCFMKIEMDHYKLNMIDKEISIQIGKIINDYETKNNIKVENISVYKDKNSPQSYERNIRIRGH